MEFAQSAQWRTALIVPAQPLQLARDAIFRLHCHMTQLNVLVHMVNQFYQLEVAPHAQSIIVKNAKMLS